VGVYSKQRQVLLRAHVGKSTELNETEIQSSADLYRQWFRKWMLHFL